MSWHNNRTRVLLILVFAASVLLAGSAQAAIEFTGCYKCMFRHADGLIVKFGIQDDGNAPQDTKITQWSVKIEFQMAEGDPVILDPAAGGANTALPFAFEESFSAEKRAVKAIVTLKATGDNSGEHTLTFEGNLSEEECVPSLTPYGLLLLVLLLAGTTIGVMRRSSSVA